VLGPAEAAEAEAFHRRFHQLRQGSNLPKMAKKKSGKVYHTGVTDAIEPQPQDGGRTHEVMGVNTHVMAVQERPNSTGTPTDPRERRPSWAHDGPELQLDDQVAIHEPELPAITVHDTDARHEPDVADVAVAEGLTGKREREEDGPAESRKAPQPSAIHLPPISRAATAPGNLCDENEDLQSILESSNVKALKDRLRSEMTLHEQTRNHAKELEKRLQLATKPRSSQKPRFGITSTTPYDRRPREKSREKRSERSVVLPPLKPLKSAQSSRSPKRSADGALRNVHEMLKDENMSVLSRGGQSRTRLQAYGRLTRAGLSTWDVRLDEKISRFQDMRAFSDSMWNSFHDWNTQYHSVG